MKRFALAGNPNCGKTTLFNALTGSTAHVGNWPGVTVESRDGVYKKSADPVAIIDLPGIYSLSPYTDEEVVSRNYILNEKPDCIINIVDATNLERNLYLTTQILEIDVPVVVALNMMDAVRKSGDSIDAKELSKKLGVPVVEISALRSENIDQLIDVAIAESNKSREGKTVLADSELMHLIGDVKIAFAHQNVENPLFHAVKLVELDEIETKDHPDLVKEVEDFKSTFKDDTFGNDIEAVVADARYKYISNNFASVVTKAKAAEGTMGKLTKSDKIDKVLTHRIWALPLFVVIMFFVFHFTFSEDLFFMGKMGLTIHSEGWINFFTGMGYGDILDEAGGVAEDAVLEGIPSLGVFLQSWMGWFTGELISGFQWMFNGFKDFGEATYTSWYGALVCDGILNGLDAVCSFIPQICLLFFFIAILEDSGYMARVAFILDRAFRKFGLSGKAFIPMLTGFGCSVPAIMATRTLEDDKEKNRTIRLITCFSCGAKAPIWALLAAVGSMAGFMGDIFVFAIYVGGIALAIILAIFMKLFDKDQYVSPFIMELPAYHMPQARNVGARVWEKLKHYVYKAGTIITASLIVIWFLQTFGVEEGSFCMVEDAENSIIAYVGKALSYIFYPMGWSIGADGWKYSVASITGLVAKEDVVGTMAVFGLDETTIALTKAGVVSFAVFNLLTAPCMAAISTAYSEQKGKEFVKTLCFWIGLSYVLATVLYWLITLTSKLPVVGILVMVVVAAVIIASGIVVSKRNKKASA